MSTPGVVALLTDFGSGSVYVGQMHATLLKAAPDLRIIDLAHDCPPGEVGAAAYLLRHSLPHCPPDTVCVVVVDPDVGSERSVIAARTDDHVFVGPDNGALSSVLADAEVRRVENRLLMGEWISATFHGRDIMAPVAAHLATGTPLSDVGPVVGSHATLEGPVLANGVVTGRVLMADRFGNVVTSIPRDILDAVRAVEGGVRIRIGDAFLERLHRTFSDVGEGLVLAYVGSGDHLEIAVNRGSAAETLGLDVGTPIRVEPGPP